MHAFARQTDRWTDRQTEFSLLDRICIPCNAVIKVDYQLHTHTHTHIQGFIRLRGSRTLHLATKLNLATSLNLATPLSDKNFTSQPLAIVPDMTYNVFGGMLNLAQSHLATTQILDYNTPTQCVPTYSYTDLYANSVAKI